VLGELRVHVQAQHGRTGQQLKRSGRRTVPLAPLAVDALRRQHVRMLELQLQAHKRWQDHDLVFPSARGTPLNPSNVWRHTAALLKRAGIAHHRMHLYRHTFASLHLAEGAELHEVSKLLGHSGIQITSDIYGHLTRQARREAADRIQRAIGR
jgi:site-specific recombinase XerD